MKNKGSDFGGSEEQEPSEGRLAPASDTVKKLWLPHLGNIWPAHLAQGGTCSHLWVGLLLLK